MSKEKDRLLYKIIKPPIKLLFKLLYRSEVIGLENIPKEGRIVLGGNHTKWLDTIFLAASSKRQIHFLAKDELFHGLIGPIIKGVGCIPVNRKIRDKNALESAYKYLENDLCIGIFPEGTINRTEDIIMPFKMGAVKMCNHTNTKLVPFTITGQYRLFRKGVKLEFLKPIEIGDDLEKENKKFMNIISKKLKEEGKKNGKER